MRFTGHFTGAKLDLGVYKQHLREHMEIQLRRVAKIWLSAVTGRVPVWSGMARGSLLVLAEMIGGRIVIAPVSGVASRIPQGRALGTAEEKLGPNDFTIEISTSVPHYVVQEYKNVNVSRSAPWLSFEAGAVAYNQAVKTAFLPPPVYTPIRIKAI